MKTKKYLIGIQPTGKLTIGNYLGCLKKGLKYQEEEGHDVTIMIANYHSLTTDSYSDITEKELGRLGFKKIIHQNSAHTELFFKLCCKMNLGTLEKMPQYKDKKDTVDYNLGLLLYPVLMAADIIINDPDIVIIGRDQVSHLDLCNDIAKRVGVTTYFNYEFGDVEKVMALNKPDNKMSKSQGDKGVLYLFDEDYATKLKKANMNEDGLKNMHLIAKNIGIDITGIESNLELKNAVAEKMFELFR